MLDILTNLRDSESEVMVRYQNDDTDYASKITAVNAKHRIMVINDSYPNASSSLYRGRPLTISTEKQGRQIQFNSEFIEPLTPDFSLGYQVSIPEALGAQLQRGAFRVMLEDLQKKVLVTLKDTQNQPIDGIARNLSRSGIGMATQAELSGKTFDTAHALDCNIVLMDEKEISCKMEVRNVQTKANGATTTLIGGRMFDLAKRDENLLRRFISELQVQHIEALA